ncbi:MAG TPA: sulfur oxidation c-type cytochrome SoxA, partial [Bryobacterales bacterium]|nr:sulfur oxidation c-type cytochrome SoxA [Bryobacterales bacterium]
MTGTRGKTTLAILVAAAGGLATAAAADHNEITHPELVINGEIKITVEAPAPDHLKDRMDRIYSGWVFRSAETQAIEADDFDNPAMVFVEKAWEVWNTPDGSEGKSCADCHGDVEESMKGVRAVYPKWNEKAGEVRTLAQMINECRTERMGADAWKYTGEQMASMEALISVQSRGMPVNVAI